jgi:hypothetical protein
MGEIHPPQKAKLIVGMLSSMPELFGKARADLERRFGAVEIESPVMNFDSTDYYNDELGTPIKRRFLCFAQPFDPDELPSAKAFTNEIETRASSETGRAPRRPLNLDPGYVTLGKDYSHRIYVGGGIYAEVTLEFHKGGFQPHPWTYPDYRKAEYLEFFDAARRSLAGRKEKTPPGLPGGA